MAYVHTSQSCSTVEIPFDVPDEEVEHLDEEERYEYLYNEALDVLSGAGAFEAGWKES